jgi:hypothetical protein
VAALKGFLWEGVEKYSIFSDYILLKLIKDL